MGSLADMTPDDPLIELAEQAAAALDLWLSERGDLPDALLLELAEQSARQTELLLEDLHRRG